jgi:hypothetical protein
MVVTNANIKPESAQENSALIQTGCAARTKLDLTM